MNQFRASRAHGVLVADDEDGIRSLLGLCLAREGFLVWQAASGEDAADLLRLHIDETDAALIDLRMPGMGGLETMAALKHLKPDLRCCVMGGYLGSRQDIEAAGADAVLQKPFSVVEVAGCMRRLLGEGR